MRRLNSFAALNPFHRRRSDSVSEEQATSSPLSAFSTLDHLPSSDDETTPFTRRMAAFDESSSHAKFTSLPPTAEHRDQDVRMTLRSETQLKLPKTRQRESVVGREPLVSSSLPRSESLASLPPSRLPTPGGSRREARFSFRSTSKVTAKPAERSLPRSGTEPLLRSLPNSNTAALPRTTAFKENLSLSPIKRLPMGMYGVDGGISKDWVPLSPRQRGHVEGLDGRLLSSSPLRPLASNPRVPQTYSSPTRLQRTPQSQPASKAEPGPADNTVPAFPDPNSKRISFGAGIKVYQLLAPCSPPVVSLPQTPVAPTSLLHQRLKAANNSGPLREEVEPSPCSNRSTPRVDSVLLDPDKVSNPQPILYWCGRFTALNDFSRNQLVAAVMADKTRANEGPNGRQERTKGNLVQLYAQCSTDEARSSLETFHSYLRTTRMAPGGDEDGAATIVSWSEVVKAAGPRQGFTGISWKPRPATSNLTKAKSPPVEHSGAVNEEMNLSTRFVGGEESVTEEKPDGAPEPTSAGSGGGGPISSARKATFMERLLGKSRRSLA